ncbi:hypothetical protein OIE66_09280 [Nonomuraea sp. NBC_01738]|uniref:hypothetical protein n=1 Tax=Nonomuraea sp. NBC_01738 TaxID=2976003 RepID=UPI002E1180F1|nr:hypothetical protein OIE66_09280 [Nonomuraea sp. NBC_01738]
MTPVAVVGPATGENQAVGAASRRSCACTGKPSSRHRAEPDGRGAATESRSASERRGPASGRCASNSAAVRSLGTARQSGHPDRCRPIRAQVDRLGATAHSATRPASRRHPPELRAAVTAANQRSRFSAASRSSEATSSASTSKITAISASGRPCRTDRSSSSLCGPSSEIIASGSRSDRRPGRDHEPVLAGRDATVAARCARASP